MTPGQPAVQAARGGRGNNSRLSANEADLGIHDGPNPIEMWSASNSSTGIWDETDSKVVEYMQYDASDLMTKETDVLIDWLRVASEIGDEELNWLGLATIAQARVLARAGFYTELSDERRLVLAEIALYSWERWRALPDRVASVPKEPTIDPGLPSEILMRAELLRRIGELPEDHPLSRKALITRLMATLDRLDSEALRAASDPPSNDLLSVDIETLRAQRGIRTLLQMSEAYLFEIEKILPETIRWWLRRLDSLP